MNKALLILTPSEPVTFSERNATEGAHRSLHHLPGSALLGWAAGGGRYAQFKDAYTVFHSGKVRFSNALPLSNNGQAAYPVPQVLMEPKHQRGGVKQIDGGEFLDAAEISVGRPSPTSSNPQQYEALKHLFITLGGAVVRPMLDWQLRTAVLKGRAADGQLFGYELLNPQTTPAYVATIEADDDAIPQRDEFEQLLAAFDDKTVRLGRGRGTVGGGGFHAKIVRDDTTDLWPIGEIAPQTQVIKVWALSDLALVDQWGGPCTNPTATMLGLPDGGIFHAGDSAIGLRRYAPWNGHLHCRDLERQVIAAGSVLSFHYQTPIPTRRPGKGLVGLWREGGLGRIWTAPPLLSGDSGTGPRLEPVNSGHQYLSPVSAPVSKIDVNTNATSDPVLLWLRAMAVLDTRTGGAPL